jgi:hypothetical protein
MGAPRHKIFALTLVGIRHVHASDVLGFPVARASVQVQLLPSQISAGHEAQV